MPMMATSDDLQTFGTNLGAQAIVLDAVMTAFPGLEDQFDITAQVVDKFYDWTFPFVYTTDGAGARRWQVSVRAWCARNAKLAALSDFFAASGTDGTFTEQYSGTDTDTETDNHTTQTVTEFNGISPGSGALADKVTTGPVDGSNTRTRETAYGRKRTYSDGRHWTTIMRDVERALPPVYEFINSFAQLLCAPSECAQRELIAAYPPSMQMSVTASGLPSGNPPTAEIINVGTQYNANWELSLGIPSGQPGEQGPKGDPGETPDLTPYQLTADQPIPWATDEWQKGLNIGYQLVLGSNFGNNHVAYDIGRYNKGTYTITVYGNYDAAFLLKNDGGAQEIPSAGLTTQITSDNTKISLDYYGNDGMVPQVMLVNGSTPYPFQPYNGPIIHQKQLDEALDDVLPLTGGTVSGNLNVTDNLQENGQRVYSPNNPPPAPAPLYVHTIRIAGNNGSTEYPKESDVTVMFLSNVQAEFTASTFYNALSGTGTEEKIALAAGEYEGPDGNVHSASFIKTSSSNSEFIVCGGGQLAIVNTFTIFDDIVAKVS